MLCPPCIISKGLWCHCVFLLVIIAWSFGTVGLWRFSYKVIIFPFLITKYSGPLCICRFLGTDRYGGPTKYTKPFYIRDLSIYGFWFLWPLELTPLRYQGATVSWGHSLRWGNPQVLVSQHHSSLKEQRLLGKIVDSRWGKVNTRWTWNILWWESLRKCSEEVRIVRKAREPNRRSSWWLKLKQNKW